MAKMPAAIKAKLNNKPKRRKGPVPPQLKSHLFKPGGKKAAKKTATPIGSNKKWNKPAVKKTAKPAAAKTGKKTHGNAGKAKSAAHRAAIGAALRRYHASKKRGKKSNSVRPKTLKDKKAFVKRVSKKPAAKKALNNYRKISTKINKALHPKTAAKKLTRRRA